MMSAGYSLRSRVPGQSVMRVVVENHRRAAPRTRWERLFGMSPVRGEDIFPYRAAVAEDSVGRVLDRLGSEWDVLHNVPVDSSDGRTYLIDHLAIGPTGVFTVLAKNLTAREIVVTSDGMSVSGRVDPHVDFARAEAEIVSELLSFAAGTTVTVHPLVVLLDPRRLDVRDQAEDVTVLSSRQLDRWMHKQPRRLDGVTVARISDVADRESTWQTAENTDAGTDTEALTAEFEELRDRVDAALRVRLTWVISSIVATTVVLWVAAGVILFDAIY